jgi:aryl-alcohol dehydrogenase-like predicted oxidoreductase
MKTRRLGDKGPEVSAIGLGCMGMTEVYGAADEAEGIATIHAALDAGVSLIDTGDFYGMGANELLVGKALKGRRDKAFIQVKFGAQRDPSGAWIGYDASPAAVKTSLAYTLKRLGTDHIDLYMPARRDPNVPLEDTIGAIADMIRAGYVRHLGLSEVSPETIRAANAIHPVTALQYEFSVIERGAETRQLPALREIGAGLTAYGVLSRGLLTSSVRQPRPGDMRAHMPRFQPENLARNQPMVDAFASVAKDKGCTPAQLAIAWVLSRGPHIIPLLGARTRAQLEDTLGALEVELSPEDNARIDKAIPPDAVAGGRYGEHQMRTVDL